MKRPFGAIAVDLGATSGRFAAGWLEDGRIVSTVIEQIPHSGIDQSGHAVWDLGKLFGLCQRAVQYGQANFVESYLGIDSWGVDQGFVDAHGRLLQRPVCYRDPSHSAQFEALKANRHRIFQLTGIAHQPFNTVYQLAARKKDSPHLAAPSVRWFNLPDLLGLMLGGSPNYELTMASTTQLLDLQGNWCEEIFRLVGWPTPELPPTLPGKVGNVIAPGVHLVHVGSHDTASAIHGLGPIAENAMFLNLGTWSLAGKILDKPIASSEAEVAGFTNERAVDGRIRFLKNIPGFYVLNRLHSELNISTPVPQWLESAEDVSERVDLMHPDLYNPASMPAAVMKLCGWTEATEEAWAGLALHSLTKTIANQLPSLRDITGSKVEVIRLSGGGSRSDVLCRSLADATRCSVVAGPGEATVVGNLSTSLQARAFRTAGTDGYSDDLASCLSHANFMADRKPSLHSPQFDRKRLETAFLDTIAASADLKTYSPGVKA